MNIWATPVRMAGLVLAGSLAVSVLSDLAYGEGQKGPAGGNSNSAPSSGTGSAAPDLIDATDPQAISDALWAYDGVEVLKDDDGNPKIDVSDSSEPFAIFFHDCTDGANCGYIEFDTSWDMKNGVAASVIDKWNQTKLWGVAYRDVHNDPHLSMTVNLRHGVTADNFDDTLEWWDTTTSQFEDTIGWKKK